MMHRTIQLPITTTEVLWPTEVINVIQTAMEEGAVKGKAGWQDKTIDALAIQVDQCLADWGDTGDVKYLRHAFTYMMMVTAKATGLVGKENIDD